MKITDLAKAALNDMLQEYAGQGIRIHAADSGCCTPQIEITLGAPKANDIVKTVNGIQVAIDPRIISTAERITLDKQKDGFVLLGLGHHEYC
ncbi:adhesin [Bacillus songklensis]|uniref:Adhesin n=1 Tax=Bacillus songklensis TaxID=1069116 RepID=A0ABV8B9L9_9BACI